MSSFYFVSIINEQSFCNCLAFKSFFQLLKKKFKKLICDEQDYVIIWYRIQDQIHIGMLINGFSC